MMNTYEETAREVIKGKWGNGEDRIKRLTNAGYDAKLVQEFVNAILYNRPMPEEPKDNNVLTVDVDLKTVTKIVFNLKG